MYNVAVNPESGTVAVGTSKSRLAAHDGDVLILVFGKGPSLCCGFVRFFETFFFNPEEFREDFHFNLTESFTRVESNTSVTIV